jgi:hypothetical protein
MTTATELKQGRYYFRGHGEVYVDDPTIVGQSLNGNPKVKVRGGSVLMVHDLITWDVHEAEEARKAEQAAKAQAAFEAEQAKNLEIVERLGDATAFVVRSDYQYGIADITGPFDWNAEQIEAVNEAYSLNTMTRGYDLPYENQWYATTGAWLRELLKDIRSPRGMNWSPEGDPVFVSFVPDVLDLDEEDE